MVTDRYHARPLTREEYAEWDRLVEESPSGTVYQKSWWVETLARLTGADFEIVGCFGGDTLWGGCAVYSRRTGPYRRAIASR